jgi:hypothetical protein
MAIRADMDLLSTWVGKAPRRALLARHPEIGQAADAVAALLEAQDAGMLDAASVLRAGQVATGLRRAIGYVQETEALDIETRCALNLIKRSIRDASLVLPWPGNPAGSGQAATLTQAASDALDRLLAYDPLGGTAAYLGIMAADVAALATGLRVEEAR